MEEIPIINELENTELLVDDIQNWLFLNETLD